MTTKRVLNQWSTTRAQLAAAGLVQDNEEAAASLALNHPPIPSGRAEKLLREFLDPVSPEQFFAENWEKQYLHLESTVADRFESILKLSDLNELFMGRRLDMSEVSAVATGYVVAPGRYSASSIKSASDLTKGRVDGHKLKALARDGATIILNRVNEQIPSLHSFCTLLGKAMRQSVWANCYITLPGGEGFRDHYDTHDVFILQLDGAKKWLIRPSPIQLPSAEIPHRVLDAPLREPVEEVMLKQGDLLYLARGQVHSATCSDQQTRSIHITIGMQSITCFDVVVEALRGAFFKDDRLRQSFASPPASGDATLPNNRQISDLIREIAPSLDGEAAYGRLCWMAEDQRTSGSADLVRNFSWDRSIRYQFADDADLVVAGRGSSVIFRGTQIEIPETAVADLTRLWGMPSFSYDDVEKLTGAETEDTIATLIEDEILIPH